MARKTSYSSRSRSSRRTTRRSTRSRRRTSRRTTSGRSQTLRIVIEQPGVTPTLPVGTKIRTPGRSGPRF